MGLNNEKEGHLPLMQHRPQAVLSERIKRPHLFLFIALGIYLLCPWYSDWFALEHSSAPTCPQADELTPKENLDLWKVLNDKISTADFKQSAIDWLGGAVRIPTESFDNMDPVGVDPRWAAFGPFHDYLEDAFPLVYKTLNLTKVNTYGLHYEWQGSVKSLKPILLAAHQDVVPVDSSTVDEWQYPPYSGYYDGERLWGRGSLDDKSGLIGILSAIETLISTDFQPTRTVVLAFGFDEEASGTQGAGILGPHLQKLYGENGFAMIVDEGSGYTEQYGTILATPGIAEKGFLNVLVEVTSPGGHSSIPPEHTSIGILSALLVHFESNPYEVKLTRHEPMYDTLQCVADHAKSVPSNLRKIIKRSTSSDQALRELTSVISQDKLLRSLISTTQAVDLIQGGVKSNALPERAWAIVNRRIAVVSFLDEVKEHDTNLLKHLGQEFNLTYTAFGRLISKKGSRASGTLTLSDAFHEGLEPAPVTPTGKDAGPYQLLSGTIKATYNIHRSLPSSSDSIIVAPSIMSGNTDTQFYWKLSPHIFRYNHYREVAGKEDPLPGVHTVNEFIDIDSFLEQIRFFTTLVLNADEATDL